MSMVSTDPIADMLTRIRNAAAVGKNEIRVPHSRVKEMIADQLVSSGFLTKVVIEKTKPHNQLVITICQEGQNAKFTELTRMSTPGRRMYTNVKNIPVIKNGRGIVLVSTSKGIMNGFEAAKNRLGGEVICKVY